MVEPADLTVRILGEIRDDVRGMRSDARAMEERFLAHFAEIDRRFELADKRFEVIETTLRDLAQQLVVLGRGVHVAIQRRGNTDARIDDLERRLDELQRRVPQ